LNDLAQFIDDRLSESIRIKEVMRHQFPAIILETAQVIIRCCQAGGKLLICGNGGSAADSQHFAAEMVGRLKLNRRALPAIALSTDTSILTSLANDYGYDSIFRKQVEGLGCKGDVFIGISTSGNSQNVIQALELAKNKEMSTITLTGKDGGQLSSLADYTIVVPSQDAQRIQEAHITVIHIWCELVEHILFASVK
jgi:D-sedoheptulose 7-phosphate isomerase